jgi:addiction module HigA family antidote
MANRTPRHPSIKPAHPGELLREVVVPATGLSKAEIARLLGISRQRLYDILAERKPVSPETALRLGKLFGDGAGPWWRMQAELDLWEAGRALDVSAIPTLKVA